MPPRVLFLIIESFRRPFIDFYANSADKKESVNSIQNSKGAISDSPTDEPVYITNIDSGTVRLLPTIDAGSFKNVGQNIKNYIQKEKNDIKNEMKSQEIKMTPEKEDLTSNTLDSNQISNNAKIYLNGRFPVVLEEWTESYSLPWWFTEQTDSKFRPHETQIGILDPKTAETFSAFKKSETTENPSDIIQIPLRLNGSFILDIPKRVINYFRNASCIHSQLYTDYQMENCQEVINVSNNKTAPKMTNPDNTLNNTILITPKPAPQTLPSQPVQSQKPLQPQTQPLQPSNFKTNKTNDVNSESVPAYIQYLQDIENYGGGYNSQYQGDIVSRNQIYDELFVCKNGTENQSQNCHITDISSNTFQSVQVGSIYSFFHDVTPVEGRSNDSPLYGVNPEDNRTSENSPNLGKFGYSEDYRISEKSRSSEGFLCNYRYFYL